MKKRFTTNSGLEITYNSDNGRIISVLNRHLQFYKRRRDKLVFIDSFNDKYNAEPKEIKLEAVIKLGSDYGIFLD
jgi:hypothetical protein